MSHVDDFIVMLSAADASERARGAWELGNLGPAAADAAGALAQVLHEEPIRDVATWALVKIGKPAAGALVNCLGSECPAVRRAAISALWKIASEGDAVIPAALAGVLSDTEPEVRAYAAWALGEMGRISASATGALIGALTDVQPAVRRHAATALGRIGAPTPAVARALAASLDDGVSEVRQAVAGALQELAGGDHTGVLGCALAGLDALAHRGPRRERPVFRAAAGAIRANAPQLRSLPLRSSEAAFVDTLPIPATGPRPRAMNLPIPSAGEEHAET